LRRASIEEIAEEVKRVFNDEPTARKVVIHIAHTYGGNRLKEIGTYFGIGESGVSQSSKRFAAEIAEDRRLRSTIDRIRQRLGL